MQKRLYKKAESYPLTDDSLLFCLCSCALFIPGWADKLRRTRTLHPPRTLSVWRVLFCLWHRAAAEEYLRKGSIKVCAGILFDDRKRFVECTSGFVGVNLFLSGWVYLWLRKKGVARFSEL